MDTASFLYYRSSIPAQDVKERDTESAYGLNQGQWYDCHDEDGKTTLSHPLNT